MTEAWQHCNAGGRHHNSPLHNSAFQEVDLHQGIHQVANKKKVFMP